MTKRDRATSVRLLRAALARMNNGRAWTQLAPARDSDGRSISPCHPLATCWCATGSVLRAIAEDQSITESSEPLWYWKLLGALRSTRRRTDEFAEDEVAGRNDSARSFATVRRMFQSAIRQLEGQT